MVESHQHGHGNHDHSHSHSHSHGHGHHGHEHAHQHGGEGRTHSHGHEGEDAWDGEAYLARPEVLKMATKSLKEILYALSQAGISSEEIAELNLLEVGCGAGAVTNELSSHFASIHSIDVSPSMLLTFSKNVTSPKVSYSLHTLSPSSPAEFEALTPQLSPTPEEKERKITPARGRFDVVVSNFVLHHVDDIPSFLTGMSGLVKEGGWVVITEFGMPENKEDATMLEQTRKTQANSVNAPEHWHKAMSTDEMKSLLEQYGLVEVQAELREKLPLWGENMVAPPCLTAWGRK